MVGWCRQGSVFDFIDGATNAELEQDITSFKSFPEAVEYYFSYYREHGYPNYRLNDYNPQDELEKLIAVKDEDIITNSEAKQVMTGCGYLWGYFPHWINVRPYSGGSLADNWGDDNKLRTLIEKNISWCVDHEGGRWSENRIRQNAKVYLSKQSPSNFRPTVAKALYNKFGDGGSVYDPCGGWGGRMFGFIASGCKEYVCCEPSTQTVNGLNELSKAHRSVGKQITVNPICQEDYTPEAEHFDMAFTSPPYYDCERYSEEETQSYIRYKSLSKWVALFLEPLIYNAWVSLKWGGIFVLNIANVKTASRLEEESLILAEMVGFKHIDTIKLALSSISGKGVKYEPMFVFKK